MSGNVRCERDGAGHLRPEARNAMTWQMYEQLDDVCAQIRADAPVGRSHFEAPAEAPLLRGPTSRSSTRSSQGKTGRNTNARWRKFSALSTGCHVLPLPLWMAGA